MVPLGSILLIVGSITFLVGVILGLGLSKWKAARLPLLSGILLSVIGMFLLPQQLDQQARAAGFPDYNEMEQAHAAGISDSEEWAMRREAILEEQRLAAEARERREAEERRRAELEQQRADELREATEEVPALDLPLREVNKRYNDVARSLDLPLRMVTRGCEKGEVERFVCKFVVSESMAAIGYSGTEDGNVQELALIYSDPTSATSGSLEATLSFGIMMMVFSPDFPDERRVPLIKALVEGALDTNEHEQVVGEVTYTMRRMGPLGLWLTVTPAAR
jgi:hypothetical protein